MAKKKRRPPEAQPPAPAPAAVLETAPAPVPVIEAGSGFTSRERWLFWGILAFGALVRFLWLGRASFMIDEINVVRDAATQPGYSAIFHTELDRFTSLHRLPLLMFILRFVFQSIGYHSSFPPEWLARLPFAVLGTLSLPLFYALGRTLKNKTLGLWCMFLVSVSVFHAYYSREAYDYSMVVFFSAGTLWSAVELLRCEFKDVKAGPWRVAAYLFFSIGILQAHLSGLLFLGPLNALMFLLLFRSPGGMKGNQLGRWLAMMGAAYVVFLPFLLRLFGGFETTESPLAKQFTLEAVPALFGRMGWGQFPWTLAPFVGFLLAGLAGIRLAHDRRERFLLILLALQFLAYFAVQSWMLRVSRFEVRYYSALFPLLIVFVAFGIDYVVTWCRAKWPGAPAVALHAAVAVPLFLWLLPSLWSVCALQARGYNYKGIAAWINQNIPPNGTYAFYNIYELRGVPQVYPTPGRTATSAAVWSSGDDYQRVQPPKRVASLFSRFPQIYFVEVAPDDILAPETKADPLPREALFMRHEWLLDPAWDRLLQLRTFPPSEVQLNATNAPRTLVSWNTVEDLPALAAKNGRSLYVAFGDGWQYARDQQMNDWMLLQTGGSIHLGNAGKEPAKALLRISALAPAGDTLLTVTDSRGATVLDHARMVPEFRDVTVTNLVLPPGLSRFDLQTVPAPGAMNGQLAVYAIGVTPTP